MRTGGVLIALVVLGCGETSVEPIAGEARTEREPEQTREQARPDEPRPAEGSTRRVSVIAFPEGDAPIRLRSMPWSAVPFEPENEHDEQPGSWPRIAHPDAATTEWLGERMRATTIAFDDANARERFDGGRAHTYDVRCAVTLAHDALIGLDCRMWLDFGRGDPMQVADGHAFALDGRTLTRFEVADVLTPDAGLDRHLRDLCRSRATRDVAQSPPRDSTFTDTPQQACAHMPERAALTVAADGIFAAYSCDTWTDAVECDLRVPFRALDRKILADSPLGRALSTLDGVTSVEIELPPGIAPPGEEVTGFAVSARADATSLLHAWRGLPEPLRDGVLLVGDGRNDAVLVHPAADRAAEIARALGAESTRATWREAARPFLGVTRAPLHIRRGGYSRDAATMIAPEGAIVTGLLGRYLERDSAIGQRSTSVYLSISPRVGAWAAGNLVLEHTGCVPSPDAFLGALPEGRPQLAARALITALMHARRGGRDRQVVLFSTMTAPSNRRRDGRVRVELHELGDACAVGRRLARVDDDGTLYGAFLTSTQPHGGEPLLVLGTASDRVRWTLRRLGQDEVLYSVESEDDDVVVGLEEDGEYFPFAIGAHDAEESVRVAWTGERLEER